MEYKIIQPPFTLKFREMSKKELKDYFEWFQGAISQRIDELVSAVIETPGYQQWRPDNTPASLDLLGDWFALRVERRKRTEEELREAENQLAFPVDIPKEELTNETFSIAMDIGMYLSQVFLHNHPSLRWNQESGSKKHVDYGQPVLVAPGLVPINPVRLLVMLAYGIAEKLQTGKRLREIYDIRSEQIKPA